MDVPVLVARLKSGSQVFRVLFAAVPEERVRWKPGPDKWSALEVAAHLLDEEREDFRARIDRLLHAPDTAWPPIDPEGWVAARDYAGRDFEETVAAFLEERTRSVDWLAGLEAPDWDSVYRHPQLGDLRAGDLLASWVAHDALHVRQLAALAWEAARDSAAPYRPDYAGPW